MQNDGLKNLKTCCLTAFKGLLCIPGSDGVSCTSPVFTQGSYHSCNPLCPAAIKTEGGTQSLPDLSCSHVSTRQCKDAAESHHGVATTAIWESHLPQGILLLVFGCSSLTHPSPISRQCYCISINWLLWDLLHLDNHLGSYRVTA